MVSTPSKWLPRSFSNVCLLLNKDITMLKQLLVRLSMVLSDYGMLSRAHVLNRWKITLVLATL